MKTKLILLMSLAVTCLLAQNKLDDFLNSNKTEITWLGIDFYRAKYLGDPGTVDGFEMKNSFNAINNLILHEPDKYNLKHSFQKREFNEDIGFVLDRIDNIEESKIMSRRSKETYRFTIDSITQIIKSYSLPNDLSGLGLVFICEALDKNKEEGTFYVVLFEMKSKEIFLIENEVGKSGGFGFRNHWAGCVKEILDGIAENDFDKWKRKYRSSK